MIQFVFFLVIVGFSCVINTIEKEDTPRPMYGSKFDSSWYYQLKSDSKGLLNEGNIRIAGLGDGKGNLIAMYYFMKPLDNWEQIVWGPNVYNFWRKNQSCYVWSYDFDVTTHWYDNVTYIGQGNWVGFLWTRETMGKDENFLVHVSEKSKNGEIDKYVTINAEILPGMGVITEVLDLIERNDTQPDKSLFVVPEFCKKRKQVQKKKIYSQVIP